MARLAALVTVAAMLLGACTGAGSGAASGGAGSAGATIQVVASTTVFAEMVQELGGTLVHVQSLVPSNGDVHTFEPKPSDIGKLAAARLIVMNGLGLDDWLDKIVTNAAPSGTPVVKLGVNLPGVDYIDGDGAGTTNPHLWMNVDYAELYADRITAGLKQVDPGQCGRL